MEQKDKEVELNKSPAREETFKKKRGRPRKRPDVERCPGAKEDENVPGERESTGKQNDDSEMSKRGREKTTRKRREACQDCEETLQEEAMKRLSYADVNPEKWVEAQDDDVVLGKFAQLKMGGVKPGYDEISDQGNKFKSLWAQWESVELSKDGMLFRKLQGPGSCRRAQLIVPRKLVEDVLGMMHDSVTA